MVSIRLIIRRRRLILELMCISYAFICFFVIRGEKITILTINKKINHTLCY